MMVYFHFSLAQAFRARVRTAVATGSSSGSDRIIKFRGIVRIRSLPLSVLTRTLHAYAENKG